MLILSKILSCKIHEDLGKNFKASICRCVVFFNGNVSSHLSLWPMFVFLGFLSEDSYHAL